MANIIDDITCDEHSLGFPAIVFSQHRIEMITLQDVKYTQLALDSQIHKLMNGL